MAFNNAYTEPRRKNAFDNRKLALSAPSTADGKWASLIVSIVSNAPRITVYTNDPNDQTEKNNNGKIQANLDITTFESLLINIEELIKTEGAGRFTLKNDNFIFPAGKRSEKPMLQSEIHVGKDEDGSIWISVFHYNKERPRIKFYFGAAFDSYNKVTYHNFFHANKEPYTRAEVSALYAKAWCRVMSNLMSHLSVVEYVEPKSAEDRNGGGNRGGQGNDRGNYGRQNARQEQAAEPAAASSVSDDDFLNF